MIENLTDDYGITEPSADLYNACHPGQVREDPVAPTPDDLMRLCSALGSMLDDWWPIAQERWETVLDAEQTPVYALDYTAQFGGVKVQASWDEATKRAAITEPSGFARGRPATMIAAIQATLVGDKEVLMIERPSGQAYQLFIRTYADDTPSEEFTRQAVMAQKPAGIIVDYDVFTGQTFNSLDALFASFNAADTAYTSFNDMLEG